MFTEDAETLTVSLERFLKIALRDNSSLNICEYLDALETSFHSKGKWLSVVCFVIGSDTFKMTYLDN